MADSSKPGSGTIPTLTDVVLAGKGDSLPLEEEALAEEPPLPGLGIGSDAETAASEPMDNLLAARPEILHVDEFEQEMNPLEDTQERIVPDWISETETTDDDDQLTDEVPALPLRVVALVDEVLERHLAVAREEILRRLAELIEELEDTPPDHHE